MGHEAKVWKECLAAACTSATDNHGTAIDLGPYVHTGKLEILGVWTVGAGTDTDATYDCKWQESDGINGSATTVSTDWTDITGGAYTQVTAEDTVSSQSVKFLTNKRFIRSLATLDGGAAAATIVTGAILQPRFDT